MSEEFDPDVVVEYELDTWSRCAEDYVDTFAGITRETVPLLMEIARIRQCRIHEVRHYDSVGNDFVSVSVEIQDIDIGVID